MDFDDIQDIVRQLNDAELAALVCLVADQHCLIRAAPESLDKLQRALQLICLDTFGLTCAAFDCAESTKLVRFSDIVLAKDGFEDVENEDLSPAGSNIGTDASTRNVLDNRKVVNVIIANNLDQASNSVQNQALELMRSRRIYSQTAAHTAPKRFVLIGLIPDQIAGPPFLTPYLNDAFFISHIHSLPADFPSMESSPAPETASTSSQASVIRKTTSLSVPKTVNPNPFIPDSMIVRLRKQMNQIRLSAELRRYAHNITTFMRLHRGVAGGVSAISSRDFTLLARVLAPLHGLTYVSPSLVALAARKVFPHRIEITKPATERSIQWGSNLDAVADILDGLTPELVIEEVLEAVEAPL